MFKSADRKGGFPHSEITGSKGARASPVLIAACHVLHRLSTPRHPSEALMRLIVLSKTHALTTADPKACRDNSCALVISLSQTMMSSQVRPKSSGVKIRRSSSRDDPSFTMSNPPGALRQARIHCFHRSRDSPGLVEPDGIEPTTSCLQSTRSTN